MGESVGVNTILIRFTYNGDVTLDGTINADDYAIFDSSSLGLLEDYHFWEVGDFNGDDLINADDYAILDTGYLFQGSPL